MIVRRVVMLSLCLIPVACAGSATLRESQAEELQAVIDETILQVFPGDEYTFNRGPYGGDLTDRMCETRILRFDDPPLDDDPQGTINEIVRIWRNQFEFDVDDTTEVRRAIADVPGAGILTVSSASPQGTIDIQAVTAECAAEDVPFENTTMRVGG